MQQTPPVRQPGHRSGRYEQQPVRKHKKSHKGIVLAMAVFMALLALMVIIFPKEPISRAQFTAGTADGHVAGGQGTTGTAYQGLVISEAMSANGSAVPDENGEYPDWIEIWNSSDHDISLKGVGLSDRNDSIRFLFPDVILPVDGRVLVFCSDTNAAEPGRPYHAKFKLSSVGETIYLFDPNAYEIDSVTLPIMSQDESYALQEDGSYAVMTTFSPGYPNTAEGAEAYRTSTMVTGGALIINESMPDPLTGYADEDGELADWVELYNTTDLPISLDNYALSNKENKPLKWRFPEGAVVPAHGYYLVYCSGKDRRDDPTAVPHANFRISAEHDTIVLSDGRGRLMDRVIIDNIPEDCSYARDADGTFSVHQMATPGLPNTAAGASRMDETLRALNPSGVYITEVMTSNDTTELYGDGNYCDWVEVYNSSQSQVDISGFGLSDNLGRARKWQFPQGTVLQPGEYKLVLLDGQTNLNTAYQPHASFRLSRTDTEVVCLSDPAGRLLDKMLLPVLPANVSYGRTIGLSGFFYYDTPTPMAANGTGFTGFAEEPSFAVTPGLYYATVRTGFNVPQGTRVYYTTDGSTPTEASNRYQGETIELNFTTVLRAVAYSEKGLRPSNVITGTYFVNAYHNLPIVSLVCEPYELWNEETGMLAPGPNIIKEKPGDLPFKNSVYRAHGKEPRAGHIEYYLLDGTQMLSQDMQMELSGAYSLDLPQKSFKLRAKSLYGANTFAAKLFDDRPFTEYKGIVLRNSGNDGVWTRLLDGFQSRLLDSYGTQVIHQAWNPIVVYLNGVYWGHYNMRERIDRFFVAQHEGIPLEEADNMVIVEANGSSKYGNTKAYRDMIKKIKASDPARNPEDLQYILDNVDVDNYFEYIALEMFVGNSDIGNLRCYRLGTEGSKWKWIFYDVDYGLYSYKFNSPRSYTKAKGMGDKNIDNTILLKLFEVPEYKDKFLRKLGDIFQTFTTEHMLSVLEPLVEQIEPEMNLHFARWADEHDQMVVTEWPTSPDAAYRYWEKRINRLRNTCKGRPYYLWQMVKDELNVSDETMLAYFGPQPELPVDFVP